MRIGYTLGLRRTDMANIEIGNIDFLNHRITYYEEKKDSMHTAPLTQELEICLQKHINAGGKRKHLFENPSGSTCTEGSKKSTRCRHSPCRTRCATIPCTSRNLLQILAAEGNACRAELPKLLGDTVETAMNTTARQQSQKLKRP